MDDKRFQNLFQAFKSHIDFNNYIEEYGLMDIDLSKINYNLLMAIYSGFYLTITIDPLIEKISDKDVKINLYPEFLNILVKKIAEDNGNGYTVGELSYKDAQTTLNKIRNKLAHGDFIVENDQIIFEEKNKKGIIKITDLVSMIATLDINIEKYKLTGKTVTINGNLKYVINRKVYGKPSFKKYCKDLITIIIEDEPMLGYERDGAYINFVQKMRNKIIQIFEEDELSDKRIKEYIKINEQKLKFLGINLSYKIQTIYDLEYYDQIKNNYVEEYGYLKNFDGASLAKYLLNKTLKLKEGQFQKFNYSKGIILNLNLMNVLKENPNMTISEILNQTDLNFIFVVDIDNAILASNLVGFYSFYQYGLEKGLTEKGKYDLADLTQNKTLDFSKLDLTLLDDPNMNIEHTFLSYNKDILKYKNKKRKIEDIIEKQREDLENYLEHTEQEKINKKKLEAMAGKLNDLYNEKQNIINLISDMEIFIKEFDFDNYIKNINIVEHIRNAIAHGNIMLDEYSSTNNKKIIIKDYYNDELYYEKELSIYDFATLFNIQNFYVLYSFLEDNINDKSIINENYLCEIQKRMIKKIK